MILSCGGNNYSQSIQSWKLTPRRLLFSKVGFLMKLPSVFRSCFKLLLFLVYVFMILPFFFLLTDWILFLSSIGTQNPGMMNVSVRKGECRSNWYKVFKDCKWRVKSFIPGLKNITSNSFIPRKRWHECLKLRDVGCFKTIIFGEYGREKKEAVPLFAAIVNASYNVFMWR